MNLNFCASKFVTKLLFLIVLGNANWLLAADVYNQKKEDSLDYVYKVYNSQPTDENIWSLVTSQSGVRTYKTQKGDTLWDISEMLFGDGFFWPKVWSLNPEITNPHDVPIGTVLAFYPGNMSEAPSLTINKDPDQPEVLPEVLALTLNVELPPPRRESPPLLNQFPGSIPFWSYKKDPARLMKLDLDRPLVTHPNPNQYLSYFVTENVTEGEGEIVGAEMGMDSASEYQYVFVKAPAAATGKSMLVIKDLGEIEDQYSSKKGSLVQVQGTIELLESVDAENGTFRALVKKAIAPIEKGAKVISSGLPTLNLNSSAEVAKVSARIFGGQYGVSRRIFGPDGILFLNQGASAGLAAGQELRVYKFHESRAEAVVVRENPRVIGRIKVIHTVENFATAVVLSATEDIRVGDGTSAEVVTSKQISEE